MAETPQQIEIRLRADYPTLSRQEDGQIVQLDAGAYEETIARWVASEVERQDEEAEESERIALRTLVRNYLTTLSDNEDLLLTGIANLKGATPPSTVAALRNYVTQMAEMTLDHNRGLDRLIRVLIDKGVVERDES